MSDRSVEKFKQEGDVHLWRYLEGARDYPGWHLSAGRVGVDNLAALIDLMVAAQFGLRKTLAVTRPPPAVLRVPNNRGGRARYVSATALLLDCRKGADADGRLSLSADGECVELAGGNRGLTALKVCVLDLLRGRNDYAIEAGGEALWFW